MNKSIFHIILFLMCISSICSCKKKENTLPDLRERYGLLDTKPFGANIAYHMLEKIYPDKFLNFNKKPFSKFYNTTHFDSASFYINLSNKFYLSEEDAQSVLDFVFEGHTAFIASSVIDTLLLAKIFCKQENTDLLSFINSQKYSTTTVSLLPDELSSQNNFTYYYEPFINHFSEIHAERGRITGYNQNGKPNFLIFFWGKGKLFLHCDPRAFSNYFLLTANNHLYFKQIMQMMDEKPGNIYWDDYYNKISYRQTDDSSFSSLDAILKYPALAMAFWIALALLLLYIFFGGKRKQRIVPLIKPLQNTSIAYTEAVAGLYLTEKSNKNIADKMVTYFNEFIRTHYFLNIHSNSIDFITTLSKKSGVSFEKVQSLYYAIQQNANAAEVSDYELLSLNELIQHFYNNRV